MPLLKPSPSIVVAAMVLSLAAGGAGYAAGSLPKHSVGSAQLKKNAVTAKKLKNGAVTGAKVAPDSLGGAQIDEGSLAMPVRPGSIVLAPSDFQPRESTGYSANSDGSIYSALNNVGFEASFQLPEGATVTSVKVFTVDNGVDDIRAYVARYTPSARQSVYSTASASAGVSTAVQTLAPGLLPTAPGSTQRVLVFLPLGPAYLLYGAQVDYQ